MVGWLVGRVDGWLVGWSVGWLVGWIIGWLVGFQHKKTMSCHRRVECVKTVVTG